MRSLRSTHEFSHVIAKPGRNDRKRHFMKRAVLLVGHGSKMHGSDEAMNQVIDELRRRDSATVFQSAFLELQSPNIQDGINLCIKQGADEVIVVPYFVQTGRHVVHDIPRLIDEAKALHPKTFISLANYLGFDSRMVSVVEDRIKQACGTRTV